MRVKEIVGFLFEKITFYIQNRFTGKIIITLNCKDGGIGNVSLNAEHTYRRKKLDKDMP